MSNHLKGLKTKKKKNVFDFWEFLKLRLARFKFSQHVLPSETLMQRILKKFLIGLQTKMNLTDQ